MVFPANRQRSSMGAANGLLLELPMVVLGSHQWSSGFYLRTTDGSPCETPMVFPGNDSWPSLGMTDVLVGINRFLIAERDLGSAIKKSTPRS